MVKQYFTVYDPSDKTIKEFISDGYNNNPPCLTGCSFDRIFNGGLKQLRHYPESTLYDTDYLHLNPHNFPFKISKGLDAYTFICQRDGKKKETGRQYWFVEFDSYVSGKARQFKTLTKAIKFALNHYKEYLSEEMEKVKDYGHK